MFASVRETLKVAPLLRVGEEVALFSGNPVFCALGLGGKNVVLPESLTRGAVLEVGMIATDKDGCFVSGSGCGSWVVRPLVCASILDKVADPRNLADSKSLTTFKACVNVFLMDGLDLGEVSRGFANVTLVWGDNKEIDGAMDMMEGEGIHFSTMVFEGIPILCTNTLPVSALGLFFSVSNPFTDTLFSSVDKDSTLYSVFCALV